jgi:hypothetical protein
MGQDIMEPRHNPDFTGTDSDPSANPPERLVFYPVAVVAGLFVLTILMTVAGSFGDPNAPLNRWLNRNATSLILGETGLLACVAIGSMTIDRIKTIRRRKRNQLTSASATTEDRFPNAQEDSSHVG